MFTNQTSDNRNQQILEAESGSESTRIRLLHNIAETSGESGTHRWVSVELSDDPHQDHNTGLVQNDSEPNYSEIEAAEGVMF